MPMVFVGAVGCGWAAGQYQWQNSQYLFHFPPFPECPGILA
jgi:hypothetical protein